MLVCGHYYIQQGFFNQTFIHWTWWLQSAKQEAWRVALPNYSTTTWSISSTDMSCSISRLLCMERHERWKHIGHSLNVFQDWVNFGSMCIPGPPESNQFQRVSLRGSPFVVAMVLEAIVHLSMPLLPPPVRRRLRVAVAPLLSERCHPHFWSQYIQQGGM
jgi:hypothetical protein